MRRCAICGRAYDGSRKTCSEICKAKNTAERARQNKEADRLRRKVAVQILREMGVSFVAPERVGRPRNDGP
jgi:predicted nucleic acid-binding Zn ribbon protein